MINFYPMIKQIYDQSEVMELIDSLSLLVEKKHPMLSTIEQRNLNFTRAFTSDKHKVMAIYDNDNTLIGVYDLLIESDKHYIEMVWQFSLSEVPIRELFELIFTDYKGYKFDLVFNPLDSDLISVLREYGAAFDPVQVRMKASEIPDYHHDKRIVSYSDEYRKQYLALHSRYMYWSGTRVIANPQRFTTILALKNGTLVGYTDFTNCFAENEPYDIRVRKGYRGKGYGKALLFEAMKLNYPKVMSLLVDYENLNAYRMYESLGFRVVEGSECQIAQIREIK